MRGQIICVISNRYTVLLPTQEQVICVAMGKLRLGHSPIVGDIVEVVQYDDKWGMEKIYERRNMLIRPLIANVDQAVIVMSAKEPVFSTTLVDRLIFLIAHQNITPVLCVTKMDLATESDEVHQAIADYRKSGYALYTCSQLHDSAGLHELFASRISVLTGQSGVGKSSLLNRLDTSFALRTQEISKALGRGKHTTRHVQLLPLMSGWVADTPGFSSLDFSQMTKKELCASVPDFQPFGGCKYNDCLHDQEPDCVVKQAVEKQQISSIRYAHYIECLALCKRKDVYP